MITAALKAGATMLATVGAAAGLSVGTAPDASACNPYYDRDGSVNWVCIPKPSLPSLPHFNMGGPRPPLVDKTSPFCNGTMMIPTNIRGVKWYRTGATKHSVRFWPDWQTISYVTVIYYRGGYVQPPNPQYTSVDCGT